LGSWFSTPTLATPHTPISISLVDFWRSHPLTPTYVTYASIEHLENEGDEISVTQTFQEDVNINLRLDLDVKSTPFSYILIDNQGAS
jgi:hypothetical protein